MEYKIWSILTSHNTTTVCKFRVTQYDKITLIFNGKVLLGRRCKVLLRRRSNFSTSMLGCSVADIFKLNSNER